MRSLQFFAPSGVPSIIPGTDLAQTIGACLAQNDLTLQDGDIVVLAQKIVSKAENRYVDLRTVIPSEAAHRLAETTGKDARIVEVILSESTTVVRSRPGTIIVRHRLGFVLANAGIDQSNLPGGAVEERVLLLPVDPDASANKLRQELERASGATIGVAIIDSLGRAWRIGTIGTCIGASGFLTVHDMRGQADLYGRALQSTVLAAGDELAAGASLVMGQAAEGTPIVLVRGYPASLSPIASASDLIRPQHEDLFP